MQIASPEISHQGNKVACRYSVESFGNDDTLWFALDDVHEGLLSGRSDAALVALLVPAMAHGEDLHVDGTISERLYYTLQKRQQTVLQTLLPSLETIDIHADSVEPAEERASGVATGFSAGIDSFATLANHYISDVPSGFEITHLLFNNVGSHGARGEELFRERYERICPAAERIGLPFIAINSNLDAFYGDFTFQETHTLRNAAVALLLQGGIGRFLYSSTFGYEDITIEDTYDMAYSDPISLPLLLTGGLDALAVGSEYSRVEKTLQVADVGESHRSLDICVDGKTPGNCSDCWKCRRTLLTLEIAGLLGRYRDVFDFDTYQNGRRRYIARVLASDDPLLEEIVGFAHSEGYDFPPSSVALSRVYGPARTSRAFAGAHRPRLPGEK